MPLSSVPILESPNGFMRWKREITDMLGMNGYGSLLGRHKEPPSDAREGSKTYEAWLDKQERALAMISSRCGLNAREEIKNVETLDAAMKKLEARFQPRGSAIFQQLDYNFSTLTRASCKNVSDFAEQLRKARNEIHELDPTCKISEPHFVNRFLTGLGPEFTTFLSAFYQVNSLIPERYATGTITREAVTFDTAVIAAEKEEQAQKLVEAAPTAMVATLSSRGKNQKHCSYCHKRSHEVTSCWKLHPEKKRFFDQERAERKREREKKKASKQGEESPPTAAVAYHPPTEVGIVQMVASTPSSSPSLLENSWLFDTGCNQHSTHNKACFVPGSLRPWDGGGVTAYGGKSNAPTHVGTARIPCDVNGKLVWLYLADTLYNPTSGCNLLAPTQLRKKGASYTFVDSGIAITTPQGTIFADERFGLFPIRLWQGRIAWEGDFKAALPAYSLSNE